MRKMKDKTLHKLTFEYEDESERNEHIRKMENVGYQIDIKGYKNLTVEFTKNIS